MASLLPVFSDLPSLKDYQPLSAGYKKQVVSFMYKITTQNVGN